MENLKENIYEDETVFDSSIDDSLEMMGDELESLQLY